MLSHNITILTFLCELVYNKVKSRVVLVDYQRVESGSRSANLVIRPMHNERLIAK